MTLYESKLESNKLTLSVIDSAVDSQSTTAERKIEVPVDGNRNLQLGGVNQLGLAGQYGFYLVL